jgi:hypothetical protein
MSDCIKRMVEKSNGAVTVSEAKAIMKRVDSMAKKRASQGEDMLDAIDSIIKERKSNIEKNLAKEKANAARNLVLRKSGVTRVQSMIDSGMKPKEAIGAEFEGRESAVEGARDSIFSQKEAVKSIYLSALTGGLQKEGLLNLFTSGKLDEFVGRELWALSFGEGQITSNKQARRIAEIIHSAREGQRLRLNDAGADIEALSGYQMPQRHDIDEMIKRGKDRWIEDMIPLLDETRTFGGDYDDFRAALGSAWEAMTSGIRLDGAEVGKEKLFQFSGPANLAKKLSQARELHFKNYDSWKKWNNTYGIKSLNEGVIESIASASENIALLERYGTKPRAMMNEIVRAVGENNRTKIKEGRAFFDKAALMIDAAVGDNIIPSNATASQVGTMIRTHQSLTKLGGALFASVTDIPMKALEYKFNGKSWLGATTQSFIDVGYGFKSKAEKVEFASMVGVYMESITANVGGRFTGPEKLGQKAARVQRLFFKLNGLTWWTDSHKAAFARTMSHHLGMKSDTPFAQLDDDTKRLFGNFRIGEAEWEKMRKSVTTLEDGRAYILADKITDKKVAEKYVQYLVSRQDAAVLTPGAREQRILTQGLKRGSAAGEAIRMIMQFKAFPTTMVTKVIGRSVWGKGKPDYASMVYLMMMSTAFGYLATTMKDLIKNKTPKDPAKLETWYSAMAQGGGVGIFGDLLFQDYSFGRSFSSVVAGPTVGTADQMFKIYSEAARGEGAARQAVMTGVGLVPFNNLFYSRAALDHLILLQMQEDLSPGFMRRMESNMQSTYGQELLIK